MNLKLRVRRRLLKLLSGRTGLNRRFIKLKHCFEEADRAIDGCRNKKN